jgi:hypothetical protein
MDGSDALPDKNAAESANRDELAVLAYNLKRVMQIVGVQPLIAAMRA